jgi:tripartite-type tricarboxylate transporter receptor subunit TctC
MTVDINVRWHAIAKSRNRAIRFIVPFAAGASMLVVVSTVAAAQNFPTRPIRLLCPIVAGGGLDVIARSIAPALSENLGASVVVDNRPGASGAIAMEITARAAPDGYTLATFSVTQVIYPELNKAPYDMFRDFAAVTQVSAAPYVLAVHPAMPVNSVAEFIAYAKANPGKLTYASSGIASLQQLSAELFSSLAGIKLMHVPYKGIGTAFPDLISGRIQLTFSSTASLAGMFRLKYLRALAVTTTQRTTLLPDVPTMTEAGVAGFVVTQWHNIVAPAGTPGPVVARLQQGVASILRNGDVLTRLAAEGAEPVGSTPAQFAVHLKAERAKWIKAIKDAGVTIQ